jgi:uncharacterized membrane protein YqjE
LSKSRLQLKSWMLYVAIALLAMSSLLAIMIFPQVNTDAMLPYAIVGYVLTPFAVAASLMWARHQDLRFQGNPLYLRLDGQALIKKIGVLVALSFIPAFVHIWYIAGYLNANLS